MLNYTSNVNGQTFSFVDLTDHADLKLTRYDLLNMFPMFKAFMELHRCSIDELCAITYNLGILDKDLFEYTTYEKGVLVAKDGVYKKKNVKEGWTWKTVTEYKDVYIYQNSYANLRLAEVAKELIKTRFPFLMESPFIKRTRRFHDTIYKLPKNTMARVNDLDECVLLSNNITIDDLVKLYTDPGYADSWVEKPVWSIYSDSRYVYVDTDGNNDGNSVNIPIGALYDKDWDAIEKVEVHSVCLHDENGKRIHGKWYNGSQKDAPYMSSKIAKALKEYFTS